MRKSKYREEILSLLKNSGEALTASEIHKKLPHMDLATVYRNLKKCSKDGTIRELRINKNESVYEINNDNHEHAVCDICGKISHIQVDKKKLLDLLDLEDFEVDDIEITIRGKCKE